MNSPLVVGFLACFTLIAAIGAQNAFVLRQGIQREHVLPVVALCTVSDIVLIAAGIAGFGALIGAHPRALNVVKFGGAAFLIGYGLLAARRAWRPVALIPSGATPVRLAERTPPRSGCPAGRSGLWRTRRTGFRPACCGRCWHPTAGLSRPISCCSEPSYVNSLLATREGSP